MARGKTKQPRSARPDAPPSKRDTELQSLVRGIRILDLLERLPDGQGRVEDVVAELQVPQSTAYRLLRVLKAHGLLDPHGARGVFQLGRRLGAREHAGDMVVRARPALEDLVRTTRETAFLTLRHGGEVLYADVIESPEELRVSPPRGRRLHIAGGASGKAILAFASPLVIEQVLAVPIPAYTLQTVTDPEAVRQELAEIRRTGHAVSTNQTSTGTTGVCVPIRIADGRVLGALTISGPAIRMDAEKVARCLEALRRAVIDVAHG